MKQCECLRCGYNWHSRIRQKPKQCPHCKSPFWDKVRRNGMVTIGYELSVEVQREVEKLAEIRGCSFDEIVREALDKWLIKHKQEKEC